ncbi:S8 family serine peptidase [Gorillibacterium massiliense]|uniref:S8 family serine peptidase n=1 Tax=Gorillibacterium massiliense TaxID=1280390 RepID=UPI0004B63A21|nr:S8 family serine peptidase [Gorillibacterium massiliense]
MRIKGFAVLLFLLFLPANLALAAPSSGDTTSVPAATPLKANLPTESRRSNDPMESHQKYLNQIHAFEAWSVVTGNPERVIAIVDTGVELNHPDLASQLVSGINLVNPGTPPNDDNGHGTNVAGVIAAVANNEKGIAGLLWDAKIMPVKALESDGTGEEDTLGEGIRYAVDHGASIVVLSLGLNKPSEYMESIVRYAEKKGVLLVAAAGNEGGPVKYPAAYSTVLSVGGATADNERSVASNYGDELDVLAPWSVFTTARQGGYQFSGGTSLAAPQVAAVCAMVWALHPELTPAQIRDIIRRSAEDLGKPGWDPETGYGLLRADRAIAMEPSIDAYEETDTKPATGQDESAVTGKKTPIPRILPMNKQSEAGFTGSRDEDWYFVDAPFDGFLDLTLEAGGWEYKTQGWQTESFLGGEDKGSSFSFKAGDGGGIATLPVHKGRTYIKLTGPSDEIRTDPAIDDSELRYSNKPILQPYHLTPRFRMNPDAFEGNDRPYQAYTLPLRSQSLVGNFDTVGDKDWFQLHLTAASRVRFTVSVDSKRLDPTLLIRRENEEGVFLDQESDGVTERSPVLALEPGTYYLRVGNVARSAYPAVGEYTLDIEFDSEMPDPNEPNDASYEASIMRPGVSYSGKLNDGADADWFTFTLDKEDEINLEWNAGTLSGKEQPEILDQGLRPVKTEVQEPSPLWSEMGRQPTWRYTARLPAGVYYIKLASKDAVGDIYSLRLTTANSGP